MGASALALQAAPLGAAALDWGGFAPTMDVAAVARLGVRGPWLEALVAAAAQLLALRQRIGPAQMVPRVSDWHVRPLEAASRLPLLDATPSGLSFSAAADAVAGRLLEGPVAQVLRPLALGRRVCRVGAFPRARAIVPYLLAGGVVVGHRALWVLPLNALQSLLSAGIGLAWQKGGEPADLAAVVLPPIRLRDAQVPDGVVDWVLPVAWTARAPVTPGRIATAHRSLRWPRSFVIRAMVSLQVLATTCSSSLPLGNGGEFCAVHVGPAVEPAVSPAALTGMKTGRIQCSTGPATRAANWRLTRAPRSLGPHSARASRSLGLLHPRVFAVDGDF